MFFKKLDMLSSPITLYYDEKSQHSSIFSGILSCATLIGVFVAGFYYLLNFVQSKAPKAYFFNKYIEDAGVFPVNASSMFNFIQLTDRQSNAILPFYFDAFIAIGFDDVYNDEYMKNLSLIQHKDHWFYGKCNNDSDTEGISDLIDFEYYEESACIREYYDSKKGKYFKTGEKGFRWPIIEKGCAHPDRTYYGIIMQRCDNAPPQLINRMTEDCKFNETNPFYIDNVIDKVSLKFQIMNHYADMLNYKNPFTKIFQSITSDITKETYRTSHLNFNPANLYTYNGYFFENIVEDNSYFYTTTEKSNIDQSQANINGCLIAIYFWMQNTLQHYERNYDRVQDTLSDIGGVSCMIIAFAYIINYLVNNYIVLLDTSKLVADFDQDHYDQNNIQERPSIFLRQNNIMYPPKKPYGDQNNQLYMNEEPFSSKNQKLKNTFQIYAVKNGKNGPFKNKKTGKIIFNNININNKGINSSKTQHNNMFNLRKATNNIKKNNYELNIDDKTNCNYSNNKINENDDKTTKEENLNSFSKYICYFICGNNKPTFSYYETFRAKLISEENIIQSYFDLFQLFKMNNIQKKSLFDKTNN